MATDYDAPRVRPEDEPDDTPLEELRATSASHKRATLVEDEANLHEDLELPGADLSGEELAVRILPRQRDEFTCTRCFLVMHQSQRARAGIDVCRDCDRPPRAGSDRLPRDVLDCTRCLAPRGQPAAVTANGGSSAAGTAPRRAR